MTPIEIKACLNLCVTTIQPKNARPTCGFIKERPSIKPDKFGRRSARRTAKNPKLAMSKLNWPLFTPTRTPTQHRKIRPGIRAFFNGASGLKILKTNQKKTTVSGRFTILQNGVTQFGGINASGDKSAMAYGE